MKITTFILSSISDSIPRLSYKESGESTTPILRHIDAETNNEDIEGVELSLYEDQVRKQPRDLGDYTDTKENWDKLKIHVKRGINAPVSKYKNSKTNSPIVWQSPDYPRSPKTSSVPKSKILL